MYFSQSNSFHGSRDTTVRNRKLNGEEFAFLPTSPMSKVFQAVQILQMSVDKDDESGFRFLVEGKSIEHVTGAVGLYAADNMMFCVS